MSGSAGLEWWYRRLLSVVFAAAAVTLAVALKLSRYLLLLFAAMTS